MKTETKQLIAVSLLPVLADFLEDQDFNKRTKMMSNALINQVRSFDRYFIDRTKVEDKEMYDEIIEQQVNIQLHFRNYIKEFFK
tara:strand:- start:8095 stop:8346 length:252 start_codon:yes stop_codon:yes gene_type:complete